MRFNTAVLLWLGSACLGLATMPLPDPITAGLVSAGVGSLGWFLFHITRED